MSSHSIDGEKLSPLATSPVAEVFEIAKSEVDPRKVLRKLDLRLLPFVSLLYLLSFLDRTNIGNAKVAGLATDLHLTGFQYNLCIAIFFIPYVLAEIPSNLALKFFKPSKWIPLIMLLWGCVVVSMAFVKNFGGLLTGWLFPGVTFYLSVWYPRAAQAQRMGLFLAAGTGAGAFGGLFAFAIEKMEGIGGLRGWCWIFLIEGLITVVIAILAYFCMYDDPENATFLKDAERTWLIETIKNDSTGLSKIYKSKFVWQALRDPHAWLLGSMYLFILIPSYAYALFLPTIINGLGYTATNTQLLSIPPYASGCLVTILCGILSDKVSARGPFILVGSTVALVGYATLFATSSPGAGYVGVMLAATGLFPCVACILAWTGGNIGGEVKRAVVIAIIVGMGNLGGIASSFIYRSQDSPRYRPGHATAVSCHCAAVLLCAIAMFDFARLNRKKAEQRAVENITEDKASAYVDMGDASPLYRYTI